MKVNPCRKPILYTNNLIMKHQITLFIQIVLIFLMFSPSLIIIIECYSPSNLSSWCKQTPYIDQCNYHLNTRNNYFSPKIEEKQHFLKMMIQSAMENAQEAQKSGSSLRENCKNESEKAAWRDCLELHGLAIEHLNQTITTNSSNIDTQTWLSSALTLIQTCRNGFIQLNATKNIMPILLKTSANVSCLISNALAINNYGTASSDGFPGWVRHGGIKLLSSDNSADVVVAQDGSGDVNTIGEAISLASKTNKGGDSRFVIYIKMGDYKENVEIWFKNVVFLGDGIGKTIISGSRSVGGGFTTFGTATVAAIGSGFMAQGITFRNTAGPLNRQAVAFRSGSDLSVLYKCSFEGYQDTLYALSNRQFYRECDIYGTVDIIFGDAAALLQNCNILTRYPPAGTNILTAQGRTDPNQNTGIVIHNCRVSAAENQNGAQTYLGRPWQKYSTTVFMMTYMDSIVNPKGWWEWSGDFALTTLYYGEYMNTGPGSSTANRVDWPGFHVITSASDAGKFTVDNFIGGGSWLPRTGVPFTIGF